MDHNKPMLFNFLFIICKIYNMMAVKRKDNKEQQSITCADFAANLLTMLIIEGYMKGSLTMHLKKLKLRNQTYFSLC